MFILNLVSEKMATFTVSITEELKKKAERYSDINWPEYLKKRFEIRIEELKKFKELKNLKKI